MNISISHVAVYAADLEKTRDYYIKFFGGKCNGRYENKNGFSSYFISFDSGVRLEVMHSVHLKLTPPDEFASGWSHVAFSVGDKESVIALTAQIEAAGYAVYSRPRNTGDGYFESCVADPDGNRVEITV